MFSSALDTVRIADEKQLILVEAFLMRSALSGTPAVLSPNQAMDSAAIQAITVGNGHNSRNHFVRAVELGIVSIAIPAGYPSLLSYCLQTIKRSENNPEKEFLFSSLNFLYRKEGGKQVYDYAFRKQVLNYIYAALSEFRFKHRSTVMPSGLLPEEEGAIERYISVIQQLDRAVKCYELFRSKKQLFPKLLEIKLVKRLELEPPKTALAELLSLVIQTCNKPDSPIHRSFYYRFCEDHLSAFGTEAVREVKHITDLCYNEVLALSLQQSAELNITPDLTKIASIQANEENSTVTEITSATTITHAVEKLDWEVLVDIYIQIDRLCKEKGLSWSAALELFYRQQSRLPFVLSGKYALITSVTMAVSSIPLVGTLTSGIVSEFLWNTICEMGADLMKKPSLEEIISLSKQARKNKNMMDIIISKELNAHDKYNLYK